LDKFNSGPNYLYKDVTDGNLDKINVNKDEAESGEGIERRTKWKEVKEDK
jgi:hypothetical protein